MVNFRPDRPQAPISEGQLPKSSPFVRQKEGEGEGGSKTLAALAIANVRMTTPAKINKTTLWQSFINFFSRGVGYHATLGNLQELVQLAKAGVITDRNIHKLSKEQLTHLKKQLSTGEVAKLKQAAKESIASLAKQEKALIHFIHDDSYEEAALSFANNTLTNPTKENVKRLQSALQEMDFAKRMAFMGKLTLPDQERNNLSPLFATPLNSELRLAQYLVGHTQLLDVDGSDITHLRQELEKLQPVDRIELMAHWKEHEEGSLKWIHRITHISNHLIVNDWDVACLISKKQKTVDESRLDVHTFLSSLEPMQRISLMMRWNIGAADPVLQAVEGKDTGLASSLQKDARISELLRSGKSLQEVLKDKGLRDLLVAYLPKSSEERVLFINNWKKETKGTELEHLFTHLLIARHEGLLEHFSDKELDHLKSYLQELDFTSRISWMATWRPLTASPQLTASRVDHILDRTGYKNDFRLAQALKKQSALTDSDRFRLKSELTKLNPPTESQRHLLGTLALSSNLQLAKEPPALADLIFKLRVESFLLSKDPAVECDLTSNELQQLSQKLLKMEADHVKDFMSKWTVNLNVDLMKGLLADGSPTQRANILLSWKIDTDQSADQEFLTQLQKNKIITSDERDGIYLRNFLAGRSSNLISTAGSKLTVAAILQSGSQWNIEEQLAAERVVLPLVSLKAGLKNVLTPTQIIAYQIAKGRPVDTTFSTENGPQLVECLLAMAPDKRLEYLKKCNLDDSLLKKLPKENPPLYYDYVRVKGIPIDHKFLTADAETLKKYLEGLDPTVRRDYLALCTFNTNMYFKPLGDALTFDYMIAKKMPITSSEPAINPATINERLQSLPAALLSDYLRICNLIPSQLHNLGNDLTIAYQVAKGIGVNIDQLSPEQCSALEKCLLTKSPEERRAYFEKCTISVASVQQLQNPQLKESLMRVRINHLLQKQGFNRDFSAEEIEQLDKDLSAQSVAERVAFMKKWAYDYESICDRLRPKFHRELIMMTQDKRLPNDLLPEPGEMQEFADCLLQINKERGKSYVTHLCNRLLTGKNEKQAIMDSWNLNTTTAAGQLFLTLLPDDIRYDYIIRKGILPGKEPLASLVGQLHLYQKNIQTYTQGVKNIAQELNRLPYLDRIDYLHGLRQRTEAARAFLKELWNHDRQLALLCCLTNGVSLTAMGNLVGQKSGNVANEMTSLLNNMLGRDVSSDNRLAILRKLSLDPSFNKIEDLGAFRRYQMIIAQPHEVGFIASQLLGITTDTKLIVRDLLTLLWGYKDENNKARVRAILKHPLFQNDLNFIKKAASMDALHQSGHITIPDGIIAAEKERIFAELQQI